MVKQLVILSGKGGTGKTTLAGAFIQMTVNKGFADCDVDAPNLHLICGERVGLKSKEYFGFKKAFKDDALCLNCGTCERLCKFGAIRNGRVNIYECEGCGVCEHFCPAAEARGAPAITLKENVAGHLFLSKVNGELFSHARLKMGNGASGKLVTEVRKQLAEEIGTEELVIIDGSPGIGCPVLASVTGTDLVLLVTEPTYSGLHDLTRIIETIGLFRIPCLVCVNKYDLNIEITEEIERFCDQEGITKAGRIPYDPKVGEALNNGRSVIEYNDSTAAAAIKKIWEKVVENLR